MHSVGEKDESTFDWNTRFLACYHDDLPHWIVENGRYAVTIRCAGSLPKSVIERMEEARRLSTDIDGSSTTAETSSRAAFLALETFLDSGKGFAPFRNPSAAQVLFDWLRLYRSDNLVFTDFVIMPNHLHLITAPLRCATVGDFRKTWSNFKGRTSREINKHLKRSGPLWQRYWYDRWIRSETELKSWQRYLARNPEKAGICSQETSYPFLMINENQGTLSANPSGA